MQAFAVQALPDKRGKGGRKIRTSFCLSCSSNCVVRDTQHCLHRTLLFHSLPAQDFSQQMIDRLSEACDITMEGGGNWRGEHKVLPCFISLFCKTIHCVHSCLAAAHSMTENLKAQLLSPCSPAPCAELPCTQYYFEPASYNQCRVHDCMWHKGNHAVCSSYPNTSLAWSPFLSFLCPLLCSERCAAACHQWPGGQARHPSRCGTTDTDCTPQAAAGPGPKTCSRWGAG